MLWNLSITQKTFLFSLFIVLLAAGLWLTVQPPAMNEASAPLFSKGEVLIVHEKGQTDALTVDIAETPQQHAYGLMFRRSLPRDSGMLFLFKPPQQVSFWMKNTFIPLDMLFVREDGKITKITREAKPQDLTSLDSGEPVVAVLEINGGEADRRGIKIGDLLSGYVN